MGTSLDMSIPVSLSRVRLFVTPWAAARQASLSFTISESSVRFVSIESVMLSNYLILCHPLLSLFFFFSFATLFSFCLKSFPTSGSFPVSQLFVSGGQSIGASASVLPVNIQGWFLTGVVWSPCCPRTLKNLFQHHSSKPSIFQHSAFFMVQLSHPYVTRKTVTLTIRIFAGKVMSLAF